MSTLGIIILASIAESLVSFFASVAVIINEKSVRRFVHLFISFGTGALLAVVFFDVMPEAIETIGQEQALPWILVGFLIFFVLEKFLSWYHYHEDEGISQLSSVGYLVSVGDALHNFIDGVIIALSFSAGLVLGVASTLAILLHEIPQEVSDYVIMIHGGFSKRKALVYNVLISLTTLAGALVGYYLASAVHVLGYMLAIVAGNFLYLASADLIPELKHQHGSRSSLMQVVLIAFGIGLVYFLGVLIPE